MAGSCRFHGNVEMPLRRHHVDTHTGIQLVYGPVGEGTTSYSFNSNTKLSVLDCGAYRIRTAGFNTVQRSAQREVLTLGVGEGVLHRIRHCEGDSHRVAGDSLDVGDLKGLELGCGQGVTALKVK